MRAHLSTVAAAASLLACAILAGACLQDPESPEAEQVLDRGDDPTEHVGEALKENLQGPEASPRARQVLDRGDEHVGEAPEASLQGPEASPGAGLVLDRGDDPTEHVGEAPEANVYIGAPYKEGDFPFKVVAKWDGKDKAGGWQRTSKLFVFFLRDPETGEVSDSWPCPLQISMAVQSEQEGYISPKRAGSVTADVANAAVPAVSHSRADWAGQSATFCVKLKDQMNNVFRDRYRRYGARVVKWLM